MTEADTHELHLVNGSTYFLSQPNGDVEAQAAEGFFHRDMRHLSLWILTVDDQRLEPLTSEAVDYCSARIYAIPSEDEGGDLDSQPRLTLRRERLVDGGVHEDVLVESHCDEPRAVRLELRLGCDFADILECKRRPHKAGRIWSESDETSLTLHYAREGYRRSTEVRASARCLVQNDRLVFEAEVPARGSWHTCLDVIPVVDDKPRPSRSPHHQDARIQPDMPLTMERWIDGAPVLETSSDALRAVYHCSLVDLASLRFRPREDQAASVPAAGLPWFMALFGRDSIIAAYQALPFHAELASATLECLAALQADRVDDFRDAEPGKILHELRVGELANLGDMPHGPYYGAHDTTPLFLVLLDEYERWTGDDELVRRLEGNARRALAWIETHGDPDGDGYLEYRRRSPKGLENQCWKDSFNSILDAQGRLANVPLAVCEVQGYAYDARLRTARLARTVWHDAALADRLERDAAALRERFNRDFWCEARGHFALALDRDKLQVDALTSNTGHLLWSGIVDERRAPEVVRRLLGEELYTGWGVRTMSSTDGGYNPIEYHNGTVWPHDTAIVAEGLRRFGFRVEASLVAANLLDAAVAFGSRLPEAFAGFARDDAGIPVRYPKASEPQAFASGAPLLALRTLLGLDAVDGELREAPHLRDGQQIALRGVRLGTRTLPV